MYLNNRLFTPKNFADLLRDKLYNYAISSKFVQNIAQCIEIRPVQVQLSKIEMKSGTDMNGPIHSRVRISILHWKLCPISYIQFTTGSNLSRRQNLKS